MVACPQCGQVNLVPVVPMGDVATAPSVMANDQGGFARGTPGFDDVADLISPAVPAPPPVYSPPTHSSLSYSAGSVPPSSSVADRRHSGAPASIRDEDALLVISRRGVYAMSGLLLLVASFFFAAGYLIGLRPVGAPTKGDTASASQQNPVIYEGNLSYATSPGQLKADGEAVAIALPFEKKPKANQKLASRGLRSTDSGDIEITPAAEALRALGGACARAGDDGECQLVVPRPGKYYLLLISKHARREGGRSIEFDDLRAMGEFFERPADLIGAYRYDWSVRELSASPPRFTHEF